jgi:hypothetical protein
MDSRLDQTTWQKVDNLAQHFHQPRTAVLCHIMRWGLSHSQTRPFDQGDAQGPVRHLYLFVDPELHQRVEKAAIAEGVKIAPWLRHTVRRITVGDFPASWQEARSEKRSHDSHIYPRTRLRTPGVSPGVKASSRRLEAVFVRKFC